LKFRYALATAVIALASLLSSVGNSAIAEEISMAFGSFNPPYALPDTGDGIEVDIIREALAIGGYKLNPSFVPARRLVHTFEQGTIDGVSKDMGDDMTDKGALYGDVSVRYEDVIFSLKEKNLNIVKPEDLKPLRIVAFQNAAKHYPKWLGPLVGTEDYTEVADQSQQVKMLHRGRADVIVADRYIIQHFSNQLAEESGAVFKPVSITNFAEPWGYRPAFRNEELRDSFNDGLKKLIDSGRYQKIIDSYVN